MLYTESVLLTDQSSSIHLQFLSKVWAKILTAPTSSPNDDRIFL